MHDGKPCGASRTKKKKPVTAKKKKTTNKSMTSKPRGRGYA